jgi:quercetin 2,3-dioxygenase
VTTADQRIEPGNLAYLGCGRDDLALTVDAAARVLLLGGPPFDEPVLMWWNFVARTRAEMDLAYRDWQSESERFGPVASDLPRMGAPRPSWMPPGAP